ncbi:porin [Corallincola platygyrae]|uniref:Porin n=1 Tax=Corallincola platygyrae TaxID=1193278 RepID=A0ABW4XJW5_9GAMM
MKHFAKTAVAAALTMAFAAPAFAVAPVTVYGKINASVGSEDSLDTDGSETVVSSNASRFGIKGGVELTDSLQAVYKLEWEVNVSDQDKGNGSDDNIKSRNQYVGLKGGWGEFQIGRNDTMLKKSQGKVDLFGDLDGDIKHLFKGENRLGDSVVYMTPKFNGFYGGVSVITEDNSKQKDEDGDETTGFSLAGMYGDAKFKKSDLFASLAYDSEVAGYDILRATAQYKWNDLKVGGMYQNQEKVEHDSEDYSGYMFSVAYKINAITLEAQYQMMEMSDDVDMTAMSVGAEYKLGKPTKVFAYYTLRDLDEDVLNEDSGEVMDDETFFGVGLEHKF